MFIAFSQIVLNAVCTANFALQFLNANEVKLVFGVDNFAQYLKGKTRDEIFNALKRNKLNAALKVLESFYKSWLAYTAKDRRLKMCIVTAQTRWRSKFEIELLGL